MPNSFYCKACKLSFAVGWFHYHGSAEDFWAETLLVCSACGTMHTVQHPVSARIPVLGGLFSKIGTPKKLDRLMAQDGPRFVDSTEDRLLGWLREWHECSIAHVLCPKSKHAYMKGFIDLEPVKCHHCSRSETLVRTWEPYNVRCPACGKPELRERKSWIS